MSLRKRVEEEDYYCLVQCDCGRKYKPEEMFLCYFCSKIKCNFCLITEAGIFRCKGYCNEDLPSAKKEKTCCNKCLECTKLNKIPEVWRCDDCLFKLSNRRMTRNSYAKPY